MTRLFLGGLNTTSKTELDRTFGQFGPLQEVWVARKPPGFGFIMYEHARDADAALREMDGKVMCGRRITVEYAMNLGDGRNGGGGGGIECHNCGRFGHMIRECRNGRSRTYGCRVDDFKRGHKNGDYRGNYRDDGCRGDNRGDNRGYNNGRIDRRSWSYERDRKRPKRQRLPSRSRSKSKDRKGRQSLTTI